MLSTLVLFLAASNPQLSQVGSVYLLPMGAGLDQYLAIRLTEKQLFKVVTDPRAADAVLTDRIGEGFEERLMELYPELVKKDEKETEKDKDGKDKEKNDWASQKPSRSASFSRGKGTIFLVDRRTREVLWSMYSPSKTNRSPDLHKNAEVITKKLDEALHPKPVK